MTDIVWHYPQSAAEALELLNQEKAAFHGGGTAILRAGAGRYRHLIDLSGAGLKQFEIKKDTIEIGAQLTYCDVLMNLRDAFSDHILFKALFNASSTPMRNRITLGGSIAANHVWSDITGPLLALGAEVHLEGHVSGWHYVEDYYTDRRLRKGTLITTLRIRKKTVTSAYHRETRTAVDYPAFTLSVLCLKKNEDFRVVLTGHKDKFQRLPDLEKSLENLKNTPFDTELLKDLNVSFSSGKSYYNEIWKIQLGRMLENVLKKQKTGRSK